MVNSTNSGDYYFYLPPLILPSHLEEMVASLISSLHDDRYFQAHLDENVSHRSCLSPSS